MFYVYIHINPATYQPFYVGKGHNKRAWSKNSRNKYWTNITNKYGFEVELIEVDKTESEALELEVYWIAQFKAWGFSLCNISRGGNGNPKGHKLSPETKEKMRLAHLGKSCPWKKVYGLPSPNKGKKASLESRTKRSLRMLGGVSPNKGKKRPVQ